MVRAATAAVLLACAEGVRVKRHRRSTCGVKGPSTQIVNGVDATECEWNWQVGLKSPGRATPWCGGMLINEEWVLTAAHCASQPDFDVVVGEYKPGVTSGKEQIKSAVQVIQHPRYASRPTRWDLALVRLNESVVLNECVGTICLPTQGNDVVDGQSCWITGWGTTRSGGSQPDTLQEAEVKIISNADCVNKYNYSSNEIDESMICAQGTRNGSPTDACQGDSGGPLVCKDPAGTWSIYGATSWGYGCADAAYPGVWARVHAGLDWIDETLEANQGPPPTRAMCPDFAVSTTPDRDGDCKCPYPQKCSISGNGPDCPTSGSIGGYGGTYFLPTCENCKCA